MLNCPDSNVNVRKTWCQPLTLFFMRKHSRMSSRKRNTPAASSVQNFSARFHKAVLCHAVAKHDPNTGQCSPPPACVIGHTAGSLINSSSAGGNMNSLFQQVKSQVTARQAAERYGLQVSRSGMACCIFHQDKHPSMKVDKRYYTNH